MPWQSNVFPLLVVSAGAGFSGEFVYSPVPGTGHLLTSVAASDGTDPYGNAYVHGLITYSSAGGLAIAQGWQDGQAYFATAPTQAGPYVPASGTLRQAYGTLVNGFFGAADVNGTPDPPILTQTDAGTIVMAGRLGTPSLGPVLLTTFATLTSPPFVLPASGGVVPEFPTVNAGGAHSGAILLRPNGNMEIDGNFLNNDIVFASGTFNFNP